MTEADLSIAEIFQKDVEQWTLEDRARVVARLREYCAQMKLGQKVDPKSGAVKKRRKAKAADPRQLDLEELIARETAK
jgi:hypothetical protein